MILAVALGVLATWRLSTLLYWEKGPLGVCEYVRVRVTLLRRQDGKCASWIGRELECFWCITFWVGLLVAPLAYYIPWLLWPLALSGGAVLLSQGGRVIWRAMEE